MISFHSTMIEVLQNYNGAVSAVATVFIAIFTIVLAYVTNHQAKLTKIAATAAKDSAKAAINAAESLPRVERAYLFLDEKLVSKIDWPGVTSESRESEIRPIFRNHGKTPAILKGIYCDVLVRDRLPERGEVEHMRGGPIPPSSIIIGSGERSPSDGLPIPFSIEGGDVDQIQFSRRFMYFVGYVLYDTIFSVRNIKPAFVLDIGAPLTVSDIPAWLYSLPKEEYKRCSADHIAAGATFTDDGTRMSINVEMIGGSLLVQN